MSSNNKPSKRYTTLLRRNSSCVVTSTTSNNDKKSNHGITSKKTRSLSQELDFAAFTKGGTLNSFNDMGHLSRRIFNNGDNHLKSSEFNNSFGFRQVLEGNGDIEITPVTTPLRCLRV